MIIEPAGIAQLLASAFETAVTKDSTAIKGFTKPRIYVKPK